MDDSDSCLVRASCVRLVVFAVIAVQWRMCVESSL